MKKLSKNQQVAKDFVERCKELNWTPSLFGDVLKIKKIINKNDNADFAKADSEYWSLLGMIPTTSPGSTWGTSGDGVGAISAINNGVFTMNKSGCSIRVINAIRKLL